MTITASGNVTGTNGVSDDRGISGRAVFLIDRSGVVRYEHVEETTGAYTVRPEAVLAKLREL